MIINDRTINPDILQKARHIIQERFATDCKITSALFLSEPDRRNVVLRITLQSTSSVVPKSIILKQSLPEQSDTDDKDAYARFARDWAGLEFISGIQQSVHNVPQFYGGSKEHRFILIEDLGSHHFSLVDSLTLPNRDKAVSALERFMKALGSFHATSFGHTDNYERILKEINKDAETLQEDLNFTFNDLLPKLESANKKLGLAVTSELTDEARHLIESMFKPGPFTVLTHGDICPDNVFDHEESRELQLIDFEWTFARNALLDGTYLRMSMPTCWCAKAIPDDVIEPLELIYREELKRTIPTASNDLAYATAYTQACGFWVLRAILYLDNILDKDDVWLSGPVPENSLWIASTNLVRPRFLSRLQAFVDVASKHDMLPNLREMATNMLVKVKAHWPDAKLLELYPAFQ